MKTYTLKIWCGVMMLILLVSPLCSNRLFAENLPHKSSVLMDAETGQVLAAYNPDKQVIPASVVKMMVLLLVMEKLETGDVHLSDVVTVSAWASKIGGHQVYLAEGEQFTLLELVKAVAISSANDAATAVAEHIAGSADACVELMNTRAKELGMENTTFANVHGLPPDPGQKENYTTAYDIALLGRELLHYPQILQWASTLEDTFRDGTFTLTNTNRELLRRYEGVDGLKTGFHPRGAGFNVCVTAKRDDVRLIAVVMGSPNTSQRSKAIIALLDLGFHEFQKVTVFRKGFTVGAPIRVARGDTPATTLVAAENAVVFVEKGQEDHITREITVPVDRIVAPAPRGTKYGEALIALDGQVLAKVDLVTEIDIEEGSFVERIKWWVLDIVS